MNVVDSIKYSVVGDTFNIPKLEEKNMVPNTTGDMLDLLTALDRTSDQGKPIHDIIYARLSKRLRTDGLMLHYNEVDCAYHIIADPDREIK